MNAAFLCVAGLAIFALGYRFYGRFLATRVFDLRDDEPVPAVTLEDGVDYVPTRKHVLFGHHYSSIAGAAPIIGPAIAIVWGWVPAFFWVVFGTVFMGAVHDFSTLVLSMRNGGQSVGTLVADVISPRTKTLFLVVIFALIMLVIAVFATAIADLFMKYPGTVIPINFEILVAVVIGFLCYKKKAKLLWPSIAALLVLYGMVWVGVKVPLSIEGIFGADTRLAWVVFLLGYSFVASVLPVWLLLQPRDYICSHQLLVGLAGLIVGVLVVHPVMSAPAFQAQPTDGFAWFPLLFVTVACGAISGFHGLVSSGTTSKQIACATDARLIGYGGMLGEATLALLATLAVGAGLTDWGAHYPSFGHAASHGVENFVEGASTFLVGLGIPGQPARVVIAVLVISFASTSLDTGVRIQRYIIAELAQHYRLVPLCNRYVAATVAVVTPLALVLAGKAGSLWPLFGSSNQLLAGLSLTVVLVWQLRSGRPWWPIAIPTVVVVVLASLAMALNLASYVHNQDYLLALCGAVILALQVWVVLEAATVIAKLQRDRRQVR